MEVNPISTKTAQEAPLGELTQKLDTPVQGLSNRAARQRMERFGANEITEKTASPLVKFFSFLWGHIPWMIEAAAILFLKVGRDMKNVWKSSYLIGFYFAILLVLLLCVSTTPLLIRHGIALTGRFMIREEVLETVMILVLLGISFLVLICMNHRLNSYRQAAERALHEKSRLVERLADAFRYIGKVNVEIHEIESALCGVAFYPQSRKEFRVLVDKLALKAMTIAAAPWLVVRIIDRDSGQTVNEHAVRHPGETLPAVTMGNRAILEGARSDGLLMVGPRQKDLDLLTVMIFPGAGLSKEKNILLTAVLNQIEVLFILYRSGCIKPRQTGKNAVKRQRRLAG